MPAVTWVEECDFTNVDLKLLLPLDAEGRRRVALHEFPELNARLEEDEIVYLDRYDLGVAVQTEQGLVVPVVRACDTRALDELAPTSSGSPTRRARASSTPRSCAAGRSRSRAPASSRASS